ncbi:MAG: prolipoprotein diacylglyceryl transferase [Bacteroidales bacterium]
MSFLSLVWDIDPVIFKLGVVELRYYSLCWGFAILAAILILSKVYHKEGIEISMLESLTIYVIIGMIIGARLGHCLFYDATYYLSHPIEMLFPIFKNSDGFHVGYAGLASHGGVIGIIIAIIFYSYKKQANIWDLLDKLALIGPISGAFIRIGNFFNSEIIGKPTNFSFGVIFKKIDNLPRHPSQLYEAIMYILIFIFISYLYKNKKNNYKMGFIFGITIVLVFISRFLIEYTKIIQSPFEEFLPLNMGQILSLPFIIIGIIVFIKKYHRV